MKKMDSIQNTALIGALIKVKNREDLSRLNFQNLPQISLENPTKTELSKEAKYPGGFENLRSQVADLFYSDAVYTQEKQLKTNVVFVWRKTAPLAMYMQKVRISPSTDKRKSQFIFSRTNLIPHLLMVQLFATDSGFLWPSILNNFLILIEIKELDLGENGLQRKI